MKRFTAAVLILFSMLFLSSCSFKIDTDKVAEQLDKVFYSISSYQLTSNKNLAGSRELYDNYTGEYTADYDGQSGREVLFGGASLKNLTISVHGKIYTSSGTARIRLRMNSDVQYIEIDERGNFSATLQLESGGNYIMTELENFCGHIELYSEYITLQ